MTTQEKYLARTIFKSYVYQKNGMAFQDFFVNIMSKWDKDFKAVKPHGNEGDKKNDGFIQSKGIYYQVYSPEKPKDKLTDAIDKCHVDFAGLLSYWDKITPIKEFYFVFNDCYSGAYPYLYEKIAEMRTTHNNIKIDLFLSSNLEDICLGLPDDDIYSAINYIPDPDKISSIDYEALTEVVNFILENQKSITTNQTLDLPDYSEKIQFNGLSNNISALLYSAGNQVTILDEYFSANSEFIRKALQEKFTAIYEEGKEVIQTNDDSNSDMIFLYILGKASPNEQKHVQDATLVLMSYFFETCDIFERPPKK